MKPFEEFIGKSESQADSEGVLDEWKNLKYCYDYAIRTAARKERDECADLFDEDSVERAKILKRHCGDVN